MIIPLIATALCFASTLVSAGSHGQHLGHHASFVKTHRNSARAATPRIIGAYLNDWSGSNLTKVPWKNYTEMDYFVAFTTNSVNSIAFIGQNNEPAYIQEFNSRAKAAGTKSILSIGGWTGSVYFSNMFATAANRTAFVKTVANVINQYGFDGVDFDWEYPNNIGNGNNYGPNDTANFLLFLQQLRQTLGTGKKIVADVAPNGFVDANGNPIKDASGFAKVLDYVLVMCYENSGSWTSQSGPNAPLYSTAAQPEQSASVDTTFKYWTGAGFPANKLVLGVPSYGKYFYLTSSTLATTKYNGISSKAYQNYTSTGGDQTITFNNMVKSKLVDANGYVISGNGYSRYWDSASQTPFLFNPSTKAYITFDDPKSVAAKANYVVSKGMAGIKFYDYQGMTASLYNGAKSVFNSS